MKCLFNPSIVLYSLDIALMAQLSISQKYLDKNQLPKIVIVLITLEVSKYF